MTTHYKKITLYLLGGILLLVSLFFIVISLLYDKLYPTHYLVLPHFMIAQDKLEMIRSNLSQEVTTPQPTIIIISPDHFHEYKTNFLSYNNTIHTLCIQGYCQKAQGARLPSDYKYNKTLLLTDHGIGAHLRFIKQYFPDAHIIPLLLQPRSQDNLEKIMKDITSITKQQETIIISSVDRSHYVPEPRATLHDHTTRTTLSRHDNNRNHRKQLDIDCPSCLRTIDHLAMQDNVIPQLITRDSSADLFHSTGIDNTSRAMIEYLQSNKQNSLPSLSWSTGATILMAGDLIYDRGVSKILSDENLIARHFSQWYQQYDTDQNPLFTFHRLGAGIDLVGFNLETPLFHDNICYKIEKPLSFCSNDRIFDIVQLLGFNFVNLANNHRFDAGTSQYNETKNILNHYNMHVVDDDNLNTMIIQGVPLSLQGYDFVSSSIKETMSNACNNIQKAIILGFQPILSVHRGQEYQSSHNLQQENIAHQLVDCGAKAIIGHHPHVVQDIQRINDVPIVYSLGNFLMDQGFSGTTSTGMMVGMVIPLSGQIEIFTGLINALP